MSCFIRRISTVAAYSVVLSLFLQQLALASHIQVGKNVQVSAAESTIPQYETLIATDPKNPLRLMACSTMEPRRPTDATYGTVVYLSTDGGLQWKPTLTVADRSLSGDPACAFGENGDAYFAELGEIKGPDNRDHGKTILHVSHDGGLTWEHRIINRQSDREYISVDTTGGRFNGRVYVNAAMTTPSLDDPPTAETNFDNGFGLLVSSDRGKTFTLQNLLNPLDDQYVFANANSVVMADGTYALIFPDMISRHTTPGPGKPNFTIKFMSSSDGGFSFTKAVTIKSVVFPMGTTTTFLPSLAVDTSTGPFRNRLYVTWIEEVGGRSRIFISHSSDKGKTWSAPIAVTDDTSWSRSKGPDDNEPTIAVNKNGIVGVSWMDRRDNADNLGYYERFSASVDGGETFLPSVRVATEPASFYKTNDIILDGSTSGGGDRAAYTRGQPLSIALGYNSRFAFIGGDTEGLAADANGVFHALWVDNRTGIPQVWTAPITVNEKSVVNGSPELATMRDITKRVTIDVANVRFDRSTGTVSADAYLFNTSKTPIRGPVKARLTTLTSQVGVPALIGSTDDENRRGAIIDFTSTLPNGELAPNERARAKHLTFHLSHLRPENGTADAGALQNFVDFTLKVYARG